MFDVILWNSCSSHLLFLSFCSSCLSEYHVVVVVVVSQNQAWQSKGTVLSLFFLIIISVTCFDMEINSLLYQSEIALLVLCRKLSIRAIGQKCCRQPVMSD